ncbi:MULTISPECIES: MarR family winged helix-turn-helix transcriptional regulator [Nocardia]|jgi:DNA-binding MarR family transcriptional regulator|uniref:MarR family transcriptional regulator n=2 Tax=Nocardia TaxID=1817 RepID=A0A2T2YRU6_9NOCA|nr:MULTISPECIES: MarR family transcriptional regulator [Nocardia]OBF73151.1 MarR family transcriptional regulator [Mycobacterium sp. 852002-51759_SCH5129042]MBF6150359.1 MarR family transcriptional regulator [Nocardia nova]MBF6245143.1 MarR family transcriptional regulator [Nocardia elegans]MBF6272535.1 MarR family transcriptional regulator [Nocardia nova]MBF6450047.1 MarR family transcriptional regulator [Nocardia elegans]
MSRGDAELFSAAAITTFKLNGQFLTIAEELAKPAEITAAWWQVLGAVLHEPLPVSGIAREMGITRQSVQRIADLLVGKGLAEYRPNPSHRRAKLVAITDAGYAAVRRITPKHAVMAKQLARQLGSQRFAEVVDALGDLSAALEALESGERGGSPD